MALNNQTGKTLVTPVNTTTTTTDHARSAQSEEEEEEVEDEELEKLELEAKEMVKKIVEYRTTLPDHLMTTLTSILSAQRPLLPDIESGSDPGHAGHPIPDVGGQVKSSESLALQTEGDEKIAEKVRLLKDKISRNLSSIPIALKRMKECVSKIDNLDSNNGIIHPAFQKKT